MSAGIDVVAHVPVDGELDRALAERIAESGIVVGPTLATIENVLGEPGGPLWSRTRDSPRGWATRRPGG